MALVAIVVPFVLSVRFSAKIEAWRQTVIAAQTTAPPDQNTIPSSCAPSHCAMMAPVRVVDAHAGGKGWLEVRIAGAVPM